MLLKRKRTQKSKIRKRSSTNNKSLFTIQKFMFHYSKWKILRYLLEGKCCETCTVHRIVQIIWVCILYHLEIRFVSFHFVSFDFQYHFFHLSVWHDIVSILQLESDSFSVDSSKLIINMLSKLKAASNKQWQK